MGKEILTFRDNKIKKKTKTNVTTITLLFFKRCRH